MKPPSLAVEAAFVEHRKRLRKMDKYFFLNYQLNCKILQHILFFTRQWILN